MRLRAVTAVATACVVTSLAVPMSGAQDMTSTDEEASPTTIPTREAAPNTDSCPNAERPGKPRTTSEVPTPGEVVPEAPPQNYDGPCGITAVPGYNVPEEQTASGWIVFDVDSGDIIAQKDPHGRYRPASVIKVLLAMVALRDLDLDATYPISEKAESMEGSAVGVGHTGTYTGHQLMEGLLMASGNDASQALAEALGGEEATLEKVNALADELGATDTHVARFTGLDAPGQMTSVTDLARFYRAAWQQPEFARLVNTDKVEFPGFDDNPPYELWNDNHLLLNDENGIGGKTGYTDDANHSFVGALDRDGRRLAAVVLDTTIDKGRAWEQAQRFLHEAYRIPEGENIGTVSFTPEPTEPSPEATQIAAPSEQSGDTDSVFAGISGTAIGVGVGLIVGAAALVLGVIAVRRNRRTQSPARHQHKPR